MYPGSLTHIVLFKSAITFLNEQNDNSGSLMSLFVGFSKYQATKQQQRMVNNEWVSRLLGDKEFLRPKNGVELKTQWVISSYRVGFSRKKPKGHAFQPSRKCMEALDASKFDRHSPLWIKITQYVQSLQKSHEETAETGGNKWQSLHPKKTGPSKAKTCPTWTIAKVGLGSRGLILLLQVQASEWCQQD